MRNDPDIQFLKGVGPKRAQLLASELGVTDISGLIRIYPYRYIDRSSIVPIGSIQSTSAMVQIRAQVISSVLLDKSGSPVDTSGSDIRFNTVSRFLTERGRWNWSSSKG